MTHDRALRAVLALLLAGCRGGDPTPAAPPTPPTPPGPPADVVVTAPTTLRGTVGEPVAGTLTVRVVDAAGRGVPNVTVRWRAEAGGQTNPPEAVTDERGETAATAWVLGRSTGVQRLTAVATTVSGPDTATFVAEAAAGAAVRVSVAAPRALGVGDTASAAATASDAFGNAVSGASLALTVDDASVLGVEPGGALRPLRAGSAVVRARAGDIADSVRVRVYRPLRATAVGASARFACAIATDDARAYCWGDDPSDGSAMEFRSVPARVSDSVRFASLAVGAGHACGLAADGAAWCWGSNSAGQLGDGSLRSSATAVRAAPGVRFSVIAVGAVHSCGLDLEGRAYCWGQNSAGELGAGTTGPPRATPTPVAAAFPFASLSAGATLAAGFTCAVTRAAPPPAPEAGTLHCWGQGGPWLGLGAEVARFTPVPTPRAVDPARRYTRVSVGTQNACALGTDARGYCWGTLFPDVPTPVFTGRPFTDVSAGGVALACAVATGGEAYCVGMNTTAQLGTAEPAAQTSTPSRVIGGGYTAVAAGLDFDRNFACGIADGVVRCWGSNTLGQTGQYSREETPAGCGREPCVRRPTPVQAPEP